MIIPSPTDAIAPALPALAPVAFAVTSLNVFTAVLPLVLSCALHPLGDSCGFNKDHSYLVRISPLTVVLDTLILLYEFCATLWNDRSLLTVVASRYTPTIDYRARTILSIITILQFIKITSYTGLPYTFIACAMFFYSWLILEVVFVAACLFRLSPDVWRANCYVTASSVLNDIAIHCSMMHILFVVLPAGIIYLPQIRSDNILLTWYWYISAVMPLELAGWGFGVSSAGLEAENMWLLALGYVWFTLSIIPATVWSAMWSFWITCATAAPIIVSYGAWIQLSEGARMHICRAVEMAWSRVRNFEFGMVLVLLCFVWFWSVYLFDVEGTAKQGRFAGWW